MISHNKNNKIAIIVLAIIVILSFVSIIYFNTTDGGYAFIYQDDNLLEILDLRKDNSYQVINNKNEITNIIVVENGYAYMKEAKCKDHTCIHMGKIKHSNQSIVCLPNKVIVLIQNNDNNNYDSVVQ